MVFSNRFGIVRTATLVNRGDQEISLDILDGVQNILPANVGERLQTWRSNLVDAYRKNELLSDPEMAVFSLSAQIVDKPEPSESLRATVAWSLGLENATTLLCGRQIRSFLTGGRVHAEQDIRAERGAFIKQTRVTLQPGETKEWLILLDIGLGAGEVINLQQLIRNDQNIWQTVLNDTANGQEQLRTLLQAADGIQYSADHLSTARHQSNVLFNILRGGVFTEQYEVRSADFLQYLEQHNKEAAHVYRTRLHNGKRTIPAGICWMPAVSILLFTGWPWNTCLCTSAEDMEIRAARGMNSTSIPRQKPASSFLTTKETGVTSFRTGKPLPGLFRSTHRP